MYRSSYPQFIAHRGGGNQAPENTLAAFRVGAQAGYKMFECDVKLSADKTLFLLHDDTLQRTSNGHGSPLSQNWDELSSLDAGSWYSNLFSGEPLVRLDVILQFIKKNNYILNIELKPNPKQEYETGQSCAQLIDKLNMHDFVLFSSFSPLALQGAYDTNDVIPRALLVDKWHENIYAEMTKLACIGLVADYQIITPSIIAHCHQQQQFVMVYTPNEISQVKQLLVMGIDAVITDNMRLVDNVIE